MVPCQRPEVVGIAGEYDAATEPDRHGNDESVDDMARVEAVAGEQPSGNARHPPARRHHPDAGAGHHPVGGGIVRSTAVDLGEDRTRHDDVAAATLG